jgi:aminoglycoside phosphotransferase (APT) family kinase protein
VPETSPPHAAIVRAAQVAGPVATVVEVRRLLGGTHANTHLVSTTDPEMDVVIRDYDAGDDAAEREPWVLSTLDGLGGLAPRLLAHSSDGDRPWLVISRLPGCADIRPRDPARSAVQLGVALARIHATPLRLLTGFQTVFEQPGGSATRLVGPATDAVHDRWPEIAAAPMVLTHDDFWSGNVTWDNGIISGVVDWSGAATGPPGFDIGWCRLDLYLLFDEQIADEFLRSYAAAAGLAPSDPTLWDLWAVARSYETVETWAANYGPLGRSDLTEAALRRRHTEWTTRLLSSREA